MRLQNTVFKTFWQFQPETRFPESHVNMHTCNLSNPALHCIHLTPKKVYADNRWGLRDVQPPINMTVDDESSVRRAIRAVLKREGFSVREAASWYEALDIMKQEPGIAMVLSDMRISGMDGNSLAHRLFAVRPMCAQCAPHVCLWFRR